MKCILKTTHADERFGFYEIFTFATNTHIDKWKWISSSLISMLLEVYICALCARVFMSILYGIHFALTLNCCSKHHTKVMIMMYANGCIYILNCMFNGYFLLIQKLNSMKMVNVFDAISIDLSFPHQLSSSIDQKFHIQIHFTTFQYVKKLTIPFRCKDGRKIIIINVTVRNRK